MALRCAMEVGGGLQCLLEYVCVCVYCSVFVSGSSTKCIISCVCVGCAEGVWGTGLYRECIG